MAKLLIFRGEALHTEVELTEQTVRIGRSEQNEIVLEDPSKGVSRSHAEIRFEGGRHLLVDNDSQNGIWVGGSRLGSVVLEPDVIVSLGPFRLTIDGSVPVATGYGTDTLTEYTPRSEHPTDRVGGDFGHGSKTATQRPVPASTRRGFWYERHRTWIMGCAAAGLLAALGFTAYKGIQNRRPTFDLALARAMIDAGNCQGASVEHIDPALRMDPTDAEALALRRRCTPAPPLPKPSPPVPTGTQRELDGAEALIAANDCSQALDKINAVLAGDPDDERAKALGVTATACLPPTPPPNIVRPSTEALAIVELPSQGGLDLLPNERAKDYKKRILAMRRRYDDAVSMVQREEYSEAVTELEQIAQEVPNGYLELAERLAQARGGVKQAAARSFEVAEAAEKNGDFDASSEAYRRAHALDPSILVEVPLQRMEDQKLQRGKKRCEDAKVAFSYGENTTAAAAFQDVVKLLPPSDPCHTLARDRLKQLGK